MTPPLHLMQIIKNAFDMKQEFNFLTVLQKKISILIMPSRVMINYEHPAKKRRSVAK